MSLMRHTKRRKVSHDDSAELLSSAPLASLMNAPSADSDVSEVSIEVDEEFYGVGGDEGLDSMEEDEEDEEEEEDVSGEDVHDEVRLDVEQEDDEDEEDDDDLISIGDQDIVDSDADHDKVGASLAVQPPSEIVSRSHTNGKSKTKESGGATKGNHPLPIASAGNSAHLFKLQVEELLAQIRPRTDRADNRVKTLIQNVKDVIGSISNIPAAPLHDAVKTLKQRTGTIVPFPHPAPPSETNVKLEYRKPSRIEVIGDFALNGAPRNIVEPTIDIAVVIPSDLIQEKDHLNYRYLYRRAYYIACIAAGLQKHAKPAFTCSFAYSRGNPLLPIIVLKLKDSSSASLSKYKFIIQPAIEEGTLAVAKLKPTTSCVKSSAKPTPFYNGSVLADSLHLVYQRIQQKAASISEAYLDACLLGRVWLRQRGFAGGPDGRGFSFYEWDILTALLLISGGPRGMALFSPGYSSIQLFKATLQLLAARDLVKTPLIIGSPAPDLPSDGTPVAFDVERGLNILQYMTPWSYALLRLESRATLASLSNTKFDNFSPIFIQRTDIPSCQYDFSIELPIRHSTADDAIIEVETQSERVYSLLHQGLSDRVKLINISPPAQHPWRTNSKPSPYSDNGSIAVGFVFNGLAAQRKVDLGPSAEEKHEAAKFRKFWGEKAELRRFNDGRILETLVWTEKSGTKSVFSVVVEYLLERHLGADVSKNLVYSGDSEGELLQETTGRATAAFNAMREAMRKLEGDLRGLEGLPLHIRQIMAADSRLSSSSLSLPLSPIQPSMAGPANVVLQFEASGRWPDDLAAIQRTKIAFLTRMAELLEENIEGVEAKMGLENQQVSYQNESFLDIRYSSGAIFRLRIAHDRELILLERKLKTPGATQEEKLEIAAASAAYRRTFERTPAHTQAIQTMSTRLTALPSAIRLLKRWFSAHLLTPYFSPALIELFALRVFTNPAPWSTPSSGTTGFIRTLVALSRWDWRIEPWLVDLGDFKNEDPTAETQTQSDAQVQQQSMTKTDLNSLRTRFEAWRKIDPLMNRVVLFVASSIDTDGATWTDHAQPPRVVASRMTGLARAAVAMIDKSSPKASGVALSSSTSTSTSTSTLDLNDLFIPDLKDYDFLIHLNIPSMTPSGRVSSKNPKASLNGGTGNFKNLEMQHVTQKTREMDTSLQMSRFFLEDLRSCYGESVLFFMDGVNEETSPQSHETIGRVIGALWNPTLDGRKWKVKLGFSSLPVEEKNKDDGGRVTLAKVNRDAVLNEIGRLGGDLIRGIEVRNG